MEMNKVFPSLTHDEGDRLLTALLQDVMSLKVRETIELEVLSALLRNPSKAMPYHGNLHTALFIRSLCELIAHEPPLSQLTKEALLVSAVYHDYDYQGAEDDSVNIAAAIRGWDLNGFIDSYSEYVRELVGATNLALDLDPNDPLLREKQLMRDSDILGWQYLDYAEQLIDGLREEKGIDPYRRDFTKHFTVHTDHARMILETLELPES